MKPLSFESLLKSVVATLPAINVNNRIPRATIVISADGEQIILPVVPANLPDLTIPQNNTVFNSVVADMSVIGLMGLRQIKFEGLLPSDVNKYSWTSPNGSNADVVINFINKYRNQYKPFRVNISVGDINYLNMAVLVNNFTYHVDNVGDYHYSLEMVEYRVRNPKTGGVMS